MQWGLEEDGFCGDQKPNCVRAWQKAWTVIIGHKSPSPELFPETKGSVRTQFTGQPYKPCTGNPQDAQKQDELFWKAVPEPNNDITGRAITFSASLSLSTKISVLKLVPVETLWRLKACSGSTTEGCCGSCCTHRTSKGYWWNTAFTDIKSKIVTDIHRAVTFQSGCWRHLEMFPFVFHVCRSHVSFPRNEPRDVIISSLNLLVQHVVCVIHCL